MKNLIFVLALITCASNAHAEWERILDETTYSIASDGERLYVNTENGMYYSRDDGDTWRWSDSINSVGLLIGFPDAVSDTAAVWNTVSCAPTPKAKPGTR